MRNLLATTFNSSAADLREQRGARTEPYKVPQHFREMVLKARAMGAAAAGNPPRDPAIELFLKVADVPVAPLPPLSAEALAHQRALFGIPSE
jgi:hypothetical protein